MDRTHSRHVVVLLAVCALVGSSLVACEDHPPDGAVEEGFASGVQFPQVLAAYDEDRDAVLTRQEYSNAIREGQRLFTQWDIDEDHQLVEEEFALGMFAMWDEDDDGVVSQARYNAMIRAWFEGETELGSFETLDADRDGRLTREEFLEQADIKPVFSRFDNDGDAEIDQNEYGEGLFLVEDRNGDGAIEPEEALLF